MTVDRFRIIHSRTSTRDLQGIFDYISADSPDNAAHLIAEILDAIDGLAILPHRHPVAPGAAANLGLRSVAVTPYQIRYQIDDARKAVMIVTVRHGARDER